MNELTSPTLTMRKDSKRTNRIYTAIVVLVALAMFLAALGSGSPDTDPDVALPGWFDFLANVISAGFGILVLLPKTRVIGAISAVISMVLSMIVNYAVDGVDFFLQALPFNVITMILALLVTLHYWKDWPYVFESSQGGSD